MALGLHGRIHRWAVACVAESTDGSWPALQDLQMAFGLRGRIHRWPLACMAGFIDGRVCRMSFEAAAILSQGPATSEDGHPEDGHPRVDAN